MDEGKKALYFKKVAEEPYAQIGERHFLLEGISFRPAYALSHAVRRKKMAGESHEARNPHETDEEPQKQRLGGRSAPTEFLECCDSYCECD